MAKKKETKTIVVLGNARGGTSITANILSILGVEMDAFKLGDQKEPDPLYESVNVYAINQAIFADAKGVEMLMPGDGDLHWDLPLPRPNEIEMHLGAYDQIIEDYLKKWNKKGLWGFKNPKTTLTIKHWLRKLENPHFVMVHRNPMLVAQSWVNLAKDELEKQQADIEEKKAIIAYEHNYIMNYAMEAVLGQYPLHHVVYERLLHKPEDEIRKLCTFIGKKATSGRIKSAVEAVVKKDF